MKTTLQFLKGFLSRYKKLQRHVIRKMKKGFTYVDIFKEEWEEDFLEMLNNNFKDFNFTLKECWIRGYCVYGYRISWSLKEE